MALFYEVCIPLVIALKNLYISGDLDNDRLAKPVLQWIHANVKGRFGWDTGFSGNHPFSENEVVIFRFTEENDALFFKLTWYR